MIFKHQAEFKLGKILTRLVNLPSHNSQEFPYVSLLHWQITFHRSQIQQMKRYLDQENLVKGTPFPLPFVNESL